ncbi:hypothetical protein [Luteimonas sp. FCS-9]|uniref:hypothetical protein n=1 Tax=Luteimonas sp. FCS-9 TaxID=1547516 RepID=UPI00063E8C3C|nr:hypothetical protein [Luteimonas sp. FCS-9]KLJ02116.1 hypothetical protein WQ56_04650 [Luteimonas sp. FCS-9]
MLDQQLTISLADRRDGIGGKPNAIIGLKVFQRQLGGGQGAVAEYAPGRAVIEEDMRSRDAVPVVLTRLPAQVVIERGDNA